jgi:hypothetical protein
MFFAADTILVVGGGGDVVVDDVATAYFFASVDASVGDATVVVVFVVSIVVALDVDWSC